LDQNIPLTGGTGRPTAADFTETLVGGDCAPRPRTVVGIGFYGSAIRIGPRQRRRLGFVRTAAAGHKVNRKRSVRTRRNNLLSTLYKRYLGPEDSKGLPGSALLFPIPGSRCQSSRLLQWYATVSLRSITRPRSMTFAGDVPQGWTAATDARELRSFGGGSRRRRASGARVSLDASEGQYQFSILISCIGRRLLMGQRTSDEAEAAGRRTRN